MCDCEYLTHCWNTSQNFKVFRNSRILYSSTNFTKNLKFFIKVFSLNVQCFNFKPSDVSNLRVSIPGQERNEKWKVWEFPENSRAPWTYSNFVNVILKTLATNLLIWHHLSFSKLRVLFVLSSRSQDTIQNWKGLKIDKDVL